MDQAPPLNELAARKRLIQAKMELHRAEMALHYSQIVQPFHSIQSGLGKVLSSPFLRWGLIGGLGFLLVRGRLRFLGKAAKWALPFALPRLRSVALGWAGKMALKWVGSSLRSRFFS